jgi:selenide, water dikinase
VPPPRLTSLVESCGCVAKASPSLIAAIEDLVRSEGGPPIGDDAVWIGEHRGMGVIASVDLITPLVDDPYTFGSIAANHSLTDLYAMGAEVLSALSIVAVPIEINTEVVIEIMKGAISVVAEAGGTIRGGHTLVDPEPKFGLCVFGVAAPGNILRKSDATPRDLVFMTKALGTGLVTTAGKFDEATDADLSAAVRSMLLPSRLQSTCLHGIANAVTDVSGFGLLGHLCEVSSSSKVRVIVDGRSVPLLPGALDYSNKGILTGGGLRNARYYEASVTAARELDAALINVLYDPQTAGGLVFTAPEGSAAVIRRRFHDLGLELWRIGRVEKGDGVVVTA